MKNLYGIVNFFKGIIAMKKLLFLLFAFLPSLSFAEQEDGVVIYQHPDYEAIQASRFPNNEFVEEKTSDAKNGFKGFFVITNDSGWESVWREQPLDAPKFSSTKVVRVGEKVGIIPFVANPKLENVGGVYIARVWCSIVITSPDGTVKEDGGDMPCYHQDDRRDIKEFAISSMIEFFEPTEQDPLGNWSVRVRIMDVVGDEVLYLNQSFVLKAKE